ncbi:MAG TPA: hypothetical protein VFQ27_06480 [Xanthobacteraceae bacterium]|nr:hypothetical protein [Xanthobacteraceae bacterium]
MPNAASINQILLFLGFSGFSFVLLRLTFQFAAEGRPAIAVPPALAAFGAVAAFVFLRMKLTDLLVWHLAFLLVIFLAWWRKTKLEEERLQRLSEEAARQTGADAAEIRRHFLATRQMLTLGFACYAVAFVATFFYLLPRL